MSGKTPQLTPSQKRAIESRGTKSLNSGPLLVSAAAGSGKTKVLVERLLGYVTDESESCDITDFLVITYTRAAANELRSKILDEISERLAAEPDNRHLRRQAALCYEAHISTIHGFCTDILRENAHLLDLSPDFRVADENESAILKLSVLEDLLEARYDAMGTTPGFASLVDTLSAGRDDKRLIDVILDAHAKLLSHADPEKWVRSQLEMLDMNQLSDAAETIWGSFLMEEARSKTTYWHGAMLELLSESGQYPEFQKAYGDSLAATNDSLEAFAQALLCSWDEAREYCTIEFPRPKNIKDYDDLKEIRTKCRDAIKKAALIFENTSEELLADMKTVQPVITALLSLVLEFDAAYGQAKKKRGIVDFADLEHMTVRLVNDRQTGMPTLLAEAVSNRFREIMVDEYQDCSGVQEIIFNSITKNGSNIFMVGDVKQSIYRFRLADPTIFLSKYKSYKDDFEASENEGRRILLSMNFRSRAGILSAVNFIFKNIMSVSFGEMEYTEREFLYPGREEDGSLEPAVELDILDMSTIETEEDEESPVKAELEAIFVAERIDELVGGGLCIPDGQGGARPVSYGDFVILLRSVKDKAGVYAGALADRNIPSGMAGGEDFFEAQEIAVMISLLEIIDNPMQDIPLIAVLRSPVYGFTPDELARIRLADKSAGFYTSLVKAAETDAKCRSFLEELKAFRSAAPEMMSDRLIWHIFNKTGILGIMGALNDGETRRDNLMKLLDMAVRYEANGYKGLFGFITLIRKLIENGADPGDKSETASGDAVKIMSIHKSKGLEFPVVILADTAKRFNNKDTVKPLLLHAQLGVGAKVTDLKRRIEYPTIARLAVARKLTREMTAEELRVLYVAMTRAREKLIVVTTFADADKELGKLSKDAAAPVPPQVLENAGSMAGLILLPALTRPEAECLRQGDITLSHDAGDRWDIRKVPINSKRETARVKAQTAPTRVQAAPETVEALRAKLGFKYPYPEAVLIPSKLTATELKGRFADYEAAEEAEAPDYAKKQRLPASRPSFMTARTALTAAERGTALHLAMQYIDYQKCSSTQAVKAELQRLKEKSFLSAQQAEAADPVKIASFFNSELGKRILNADRLYREFKFSLLVRAGNYYALGEQDDDEILFQGVIDCCFEENGALHVLDFKTDHVTPERLEDKKRSYTEQLSAYACAMERITGLQVKSKILYFFELNKAVEI
jgi:ATP-dependent helicase/nuclease subunit A